MLGWLYLICRNKHREADKMKRKRNMSQMKEQNKTPENELNKMEARNLPGTSLAGVAQKTELWPVNQSVHAWVVGQVPYWGCAVGSQSMFHSHTGFSHMSMFSTSFSPSPPLSLNLNNFFFNFIKKEPTRCRVQSTGYNDAQ